MNKLLGMSILSMALALAACGGGDSDSSGTHTSSFNSKLGNGNAYSCPSKEALSQCKTDSMCVAAKCELTEKATTPSDTTTNTKCKISGKTVTGINDKSCKFENKAAEANLTITCNSGSMQLDGSIGGFNSTGSTFSSGMTLNGYTLQCP